MSEKTTKSSGKLQGLQVLRGAAALLVVWHHLKYNLGVRSKMVSDIPILATNLGAIGVDVFFVISGFVIAMTAARLNKDWRTYLASRITRIVPLYFAISTFVLLRVIGIHLFFQNQDWPAFSSVFNSYLFIPLLDTGNFSSPLCPNGWTLSFEMWFYLAFGVCMAFAGGNLAGKILPGFMVFGVLATLFFYTSDNWFLPRFLFHPMTLEFCAGCVLYQARNFLTGKTAFICLCLLTLVFLFFANQTQILGLQILGAPYAPMLALERAGIWGSFAFCLVGIITQLDLQYSLAWPAFLLILGDASYSIYLITPLVMTPTAALIHGLKHIHLVCTITGTEIISGSFYLLGTIFGGIALWKFFEVPATGKAKQFFQRFMQSLQRCLPNQGKSSR